MKRRTPNTERRTSNTEWRGPLVRVNEANSGYAVPKKTKYDLEDRLLQFAVAVVELTDDLPNTRSGNHIAGQLLRCGTSPYGHHGEVESAESRKDFIHKLKVCLKELRETRRWLRLVSRLKKRAGTQHVMTPQKSPFDVRCSAFGVRCLIFGSFISRGLLGARSREKP